MSEEKLNAIREIRFGGLLQLASKKLRYKLLHWLITHYDVTSHIIMMESACNIQVLDSNVGVVMGIPCSCEDIIVFTHRTCAPIAREYTLSKLEKYLIELPIGDQFKKVLSFSHQLLY